MEITIEQMCKYLGIVFFIGLMVIVFSINIQILEWFYITLWTLINVGLICIVFIILDLLDNRKKKEMID